MRISLLLILNLIQLSLSKIILYVDSSSLSSGNGLTANDPMNKIEDALGNSGDDLEIVLISSLQPYLIKSAFEFPKTLKIFSNSLLSPTLQFTKSGSLSFLSNTTMKDLIITSSANNVVDILDTAEILKFGGDNKYLDRVLEGLEIKALEFSHVSFLTGTMGNFKLRNISFSEIKATSISLMKINQCELIESQNVSFRAMNFANSKILEADCKFSTDSLSITSGQFEHSASNSLISSINLLLKGFIANKNLLKNNIFIETSGPSAQIALESAVISENSEQSDSGTLLISSQHPSATISLKNSLIRLNYASGIFIDLTSLNSIVLLSNITVVRNVFLSCFNLKGPSMSVSINGLYVNENNDITTLYPTLYSNSKLSQKLDSFGQALFLRDYISITIVNLSFMNNLAQNTLQGLGLQHIESYIEQLTTDSNFPEVSILGFKCENNKGFHTKTPLQFGNCLSLQVIGKLSIVSSSFNNNELDIDIKTLTTGATSPCIYAVSTSIELSVINTVFDKNKGYDGCHCITFIGDKLALSNSNFTNLRSIKQIESIFNKAGAISVGAKSVVLNNILINSCVAQKAAGILFQNLGNLKENLVLADGLVIRNNIAKQTAGLEFDGSLPSGKFLFKNSLFDNNSVEFYGVVALFFNNFININFTQSEFKNNRGISAGALFLLFNLLGDLYCFDSKFFNNTLIGDKVFIGGSVVLVYGGVISTYIHFHRCYFLSNYCSTKGGAISISYGIMKLNDSIFEGNSAPLGGSITVGYGSKIFLYNATIIGGKTYVEIKEAAGLFVNDEAISILLECKFVNLRATYTAAVKMHGINSRINITSTLFIGNYGVQGAVIDLFNRFFAWPIFITSCVIQGNTGENELIYTKSVRLIINKLTLIQNTGKLLVLTETESQIQEFYLINHICPEKVDQGCFATVSLGSKVGFLGGGFQNVSSGFERDFFLVKDSSATIYGLIYKGVTTKSEIGLAYVLNSDLTLIALQISNMVTNLLYLENSILNITGSSFMNITHLSNYKNGILQCFYCTRVDISFNNFNSIKTKSLGGVLYLWRGVGTQDNFLISFNNFTNVYSQSGGVIYAEEQNLKFIKNNASENNASDKGGVLFLKTDYKSNINWTVKDNTFVSNEAKSGGTVHSLGNIPIGVYNNFYMNNKATYGKDYSSFAVRLTLEKQLTYNNETSPPLLTLNCSNLNENCSIKNVPSGLSFENILVSIIDTYGQKMVLEETIGNIDIAYKTDYSSNISFGQGEVPDLLAGPSSMTILKGVKSVKSFKGVFNFSELTMIATPKSKVVLVVKSDLIKGFMPEYITSTSVSDLSTLKGNLYNFLFIMELRNCLRGEIYMAKENICFPCPEGKYSFDIKDSECKQCPENAFCEGRDRIIVDHGYWRSSLNSTKLWKCNVVSDPCLGGLNSLCKDGYSSTICGSCAFDSSGTKYFKNGIFYCFPCDDLYKYMIVLALGVVLLVIVLIFLVWSKQRQSVSEGALIKLLINHVQFVSFISNIKITLPDLLQNFSSMQAPMTSADTFVFAMDCFKDKFTIPLYSVKILLSMGITIFIILVNCLVFFIIMKKKRKTFEETLVSIVNSLVIVAMFLQPQFINFYIQMLSCETYDYSYMVNYLDQRCWEGEHLWYSLFITVPMLIFWMFVYPGSFLIYMYRNRTKLNDHNVLRITVFFRAGFKQRLYFWEFVIMSRKFCIILLTAFLRNEMESVIYVLIPIIAIYCALQIYVHPYNQAKFNFLEIISLNASFITYYSAIFYLKVISGGLKLVFLVIILGANLSFVLLWFHQYILKLKESMGKVGTMLSRMGTSVRKSVRKSMVNQQVQITSPSTSRKLFK